MVFIWRLVSLILIGVEVLVLPRVVKLWTNR